MENKRLENIIVYNSWFEIFETKLTEEQIGKFILSVGRWKNGQELFSDDPKVEGMLFTIEKDLNDMLNNYNNIVERNKKNGKKGGRPSKTHSVITETQETHSVIQEPKKPRETQDNPKNLKEKEKEILDKDISLSNNKEVNVSVDGVMENPSGIFPPIHQHETNQIDYKKLGGYGKFLQSFPQNKQRDIELGMEIWNNLLQEEKQEVMRHVKIYIREMEFKKQQNYIKNTLSYLQSKMWENMKPKQAVTKPINRGFVNMTFVNWFAKVYGVTDKEAQTLIYAESDDEQYQELYKEFKKTQPC